MGKGGRGVNRAAELRLARHLPAAALARVGGADDARGEGPGDGVALERADERRLRLRLQLGLQVRADDARDLAVVGGVDLADRDRAGLARLVGVERDLALGVVRALG